MKNDCCYLPNGIVVGVTPVFGGFKFQAKSHEDGSFPPEWIVCLSTKEGPDFHSEDASESGSRPFTVPSLDCDALYISSLSLPPCKDLKPSSAPTRLVAMVLWVTFSWYFQEPDPTSSKPGPHSTSNAGPRTKEWLLNIQPLGILSRKDQMIKIERLGMVASRDTSVNSKPNMFITQKAFWQLDPRTHLFSISSVMPEPGQVYPGPAGSLDSLGVGFPFGAGPHTAGTFLPPYYPPQPLEYIHTGHIRHPRRPKAYIQGEVFYVRWIPSGGEYLTFRVPVLPTTNALHRHPSTSSERSNSGPNLCLDSELSNDLQLVYDWVQKRPPDTALPRRKSIVEQSNFLEERMRAQNSFPVLVCWDSHPMGYFELFWVLEDPVSQFLDHADDFDRGVRCFIGEEEFLEPTHLKRCMSSLVHHCWLYDLRTNTVVFECRADNHDVIFALESIGFNRLKNVKSPDQDNTIMTIDRGRWIAPVI